MDLILPMATTTTMDSRLVLVLVQVVPTRITTIVIITITWLLAVGEV